MTEATSSNDGALRTLASIAALPRLASVFSRTRSSTKCATTPSLPGDVMIRSRSAPADLASSATSSMPGVSTTGSSSLGTVLVAGRNLVPRPAAGTTAVLGIGGVFGTDEYSLNSSVLALLTLDVIPTP